MPNLSFRRRPTRMEASELRRRLEGALAEAFPSHPFEVSEHDDSPLVRWQDGPSGGHVADVVATIVNWDVRTLAAREGPGPAVLLDRAFSDAAIAVAVVRFQGSHVRPFDSGRSDARRDLSALLEVDDPSRSGYPVVDAMAQLLLEAPAPDDLVLAPDATRADRLAASLTALGYDRLWAVAWSGVE